MKNNKALETVLLSITLGVLGAALFMSAAVRADSNKYGTEQPYVAAYGIVTTTADMNDEGNTIVTVEGREPLVLPDCGEYRMGDRIYLLYDSKGTVNVGDDILIQPTNITEMERR